MRRRLFEDSGYPDGLFLLDKDANVLDKNADSYPAGAIKAYGFKAGDGNYYAVDAEVTSDRYYWGGYNKLIGTLPQMDYGEVGKDYNGEYNTAEIIKALNGYNDGYTTGAPAAEACRAKTFNGKQGFLPTARQLYDFCNYKSELDSILTKFSLNAFPTDYPYWSSNQYEADLSWILDWSYEELVTDVRSNRNHIMIFFAL